MSGRQSQEKRKQGGRQCRDSKGGEGRKGKEEVKRREEH